MPNSKRDGPEKPQGIPTVSYAAAGLFIELLHDPHGRTTSLAIAASGKPVRIAASFDLPSGERLVPYSAGNNLIATGCVLLPSAVCDFGDKAQLLWDVRTFLRRYVDLSPTFEEIAAHYVLLTWVNDAFNELPYLRFRGDYGTGKTRALLAVGSLCYKPFFASGASTVSPIFHVLDAFSPTLILDEADFRFSDATAELTKILNNGNVKGLPVLRTMTNRHRELNPQAFRVFGPKLVAMREGFSDRALESRFLTEETGRRALPPHIPIHLPNSLATEALALRNRLLAWRFAVQPSIRPDPSRLIEGVEPRVNQTALALLSLIDDRDLRGRVAEALVGEDAARRSERTETEEAQILGALLEAFAESDGAQVRIGEVSERLSRKTLDGFYLAPTAKRIGWVIRHRLRIESRKSNGVFVVPATERTKLERLALRFGIAGVHATAARPSSGLSPALEGSVPSEHEVPSAAEGEDAEG